MKPNKFIATILLCLGATSLAQAITPGQADYLDRLYRIGLDRAPDEGGWTFFSNTISSQACNKEQAKSLTLGFFTSAEFNNANLTTAQQLSRVYRVVLNRVPDDGGLVYWGDLIDSKAVTLGAIIEAFINSEEFTGGILPTYCAPAASGCTLDSQVYPVDTKPYDDPTRPAYDRSSNPVFLTQIVSSNADGTRNFRCQKQIQRVTPTMTCTTTGWQKGERTAPKTVKTWFPRSKPAAYVCAE